MAGHGSPPPEDRANHPARGVGRDAFDAPLAHRLYSGNPADLPSEAERAAFRAKPENQPGTPEYEAKTDTAVDWLMSVRKHGLAKANEMFP